MRALWLPSPLCRRATCQMPPSLLLLPQHTPAHPPVTEALEWVVRGEAWWNGPCAVRVIRVEARKQEYLKYFNILCGVGPAPTQKGQWKVSCGIQDPPPQIGSLESGLCCT